MSVLYILLALLIFGLLIFIHELGHFLAARACGVKILEFAIGMGPKIFSRKSKKSGTVYALRLFPIGGFVSMLGENGMEAVQGENGDPSKSAEAQPTLINELSDASNAPEPPPAPEPVDPELAAAAYCNQSVWKRLFISAAGPLMNIILGFLLMLVFVLISGSDALLSNKVGGFFIEYSAETAEDGFQKGDFLFAIDGERVLSKADLEATIRKKEGKAAKLEVLRPIKNGADSETVALTVTLRPDLIKSFDFSVSDETGLERDDVVLKVNSTSVHTYNELAYEVMNQGYRAMDLTVLRDGKEIVLRDVQVPTQIESGAALGVVDFIPYAERDTGVLTVLKHTFFRSVSTVKMVFDSIFGLFSGRYGVETVSGPVGITKVVGEATQYGFTTVLNIIIVISINLGVMNLLPLPALDGGHILIYLIELIRRKPLKPEVEGMINFIGLILLLSLAVIIAFKDIFTLL